MHDIIVSLQTLLRGEDGAKVSYSRCVFALFLGDTICHSPNCFCPECERTAGRFDGRSDERAGA